MTHSTTRAPPLWCLPKNPVGGSIFLVSVRKDPRVDAPFISLSASIGERAGVRCRCFSFSISRASTLGPSPPDLVPLSHPMGEGPGVRAFSSTPQPRRRAMPPLALLDNVLGSRSRLSRLPSYAAADRLAQLD